ncbi:MAG: SUF system Fe-S cluster assembly regulator [Rhodospirillaceae bacterium]|nr:SUF system Fe-S cluster assembly regulator [Rhodospirillaceae bacterium]
MIRVSRMADYGVVAMTHIARAPRARHTAASIAVQTGVPQPSASKLLKLLAKAGILTSHRGAKGGYVLAYPPEKVSVADLVAAVDGPISLADCLDGPSGICELESFCSVRGPWQKISDAIRVALEEVTLADMAQAAEGVGELPAPAQSAGREHAS